MMDIQRHVITYPGFAEGKDAKGLYTDLQAEYGDRYEFHILPFYEEILDKGRVVHNVDRHADAVQRYMDDLEGEITLLGKCGGTRVVGAMDDEHIARFDKIALINMPWGTITRERLKGMFRGWKGGTLPDGSWFIPRGPSPDAGRYIIDDDYLDTVGSIDMKKRARQIARLTKLFIVRGLEDEVLGDVWSEAIPEATLIDIEGGDHHLTGESRQKVIIAFAQHGVL